MDDKAGVYTAPNLLVMFIHVTFHVLDAPASSLGSDWQKCRRASLNAQHVCKQHEGMDPSCLSSVVQAAAAGVMMWHTSFKASY